MQPKPLPIVILEVEEDASPNPSLKKSQKTFAGGFKSKKQDEAPNSSNNMSKYRLDHTGHSSSPKKNIMPLESSMTTIYDQFGLIQSGKALAVVEDKQRHMKVNRENVLKGLMEDNSLGSGLIERGTHVPGMRMDQSKLRSQIIEHVPSSIELASLDLEGVQARLQAHRAKMAQSHQQYASKYGKFQVPATSYPNPKRLNLTGINNSHQQPQVYQIIKKAQSQTEQDVLIEEMWQQHKEANPKLKAYELQYQQYLVDKATKAASRTQNNAWDKFKQLNKSKSRSKSKSKGKPMTGSFIQSASSLFRQTSQSIPTSGVQTTKLGLFQGHQQNFPAKKDNKFIASYIMAQLDPSKSGMVSKEQLFEYIRSNKHLVQMYQVDLNWLFTDLDGFITTRKGLLTRQELIEFLHKTSQAEHPEIKLTSVDSLKPRQLKEHFQTHTRHFKRVFDSLDINSDQILLRQVYIDTVKTDGFIAPLLDKVAVSLEPIGKQLTYREMLRYILDDYKKESNARAKKSKQYITWERFEEYFLRPEGINLGLVEKKEASATAQHEIFDIAPQYLQLLRDIYSGLPHVFQDYVVTNDFVQIALRNPQVKLIGDELCRIKSIETDLPVETIKTVLNRMMRETDEYENWSSIKEFFARRGRPLGWSQEALLIKRQKRQLLATQKSKTKGLNFEVIATNKRTKQQNPSGGVDKAGVMGVSQGITSSIKQPKKKQSRPQSTQKTRYTVPEPFNLTTANQKTSSKEISEQLQKALFRAKPVDRQILEPKPDLIQGKVAKTQKTVKYDYSNYENDRIARALQKAQQEFEEAQRTAQIKKNTNVKAKPIAVDLKTPYDQIIKKVRTDSAIKKTPTVPIQTKLYPENPTGEGKRKIEKARQRLEKKLQIDSQKEVEVKKENDAKHKAAEEKAAKAAEARRKRDQQAEAEARKLDSHPFKPSIKKRNLTEVQRENIQKAKQAREKNSLEEQAALIRAREEHKRKVLGHQTKDWFIDITGLGAAQIFDCLGEINLAHLLVPEDRHLLSAQLNLKTKKEVNENLRGWMKREQAMLEASDKVLQEGLKAGVERIQEKNMKVVNKVTNVDEGFLRDDTTFHRSKALRRYRDLMNGVEPREDDDRF